jgi:Spy/CpxP family protein refolding chaperone
MTFRRVSSSLICFGFLAGSSVVAVAAMPKQDANAPAAGSQQTMAPKQSQRERLKAAVDELNLTDEQKAKLGPIFDDAKAKSDEVRGDATLTADQKKAKMKEIGADLHAKVRAVLTPEQQEQLKAKMQAEHPKPSM